MKIVYVAKSFIPSRMANSIHVMNMCSAFASLGHEVTLLLPDDEGYRLDIDPFDFYGIEPNFKIQKLFYPSLKGKTLFYSIATYSAIKRISPDLVVGRFVNGCAISSNIGVSTVFDTHGPIWNGRIDKAFFKWMLNGKGLRRITTNSSALREMYLNTDLFEGKKFDTANLVVANNGANPYPLDEVPSQLPGQDAFPFKVGYFGHLYEGRGIEVIIALAKRFPDFGFYVGGGEEKDIAYWKLKEPLKNIFFLGYITFGEVYKYRNACDVLLAPYQKVVSPGGEQANQEPYMNPIKLIEYMSSKKAIIASDLPSVREVLLHDEDALLVPYDDFRSWGDALELLESRKELSDRLSNNAHRKFMSSFTWKNRAKKMLGDI